MFVATYTVTRPELSVPFFFETDAGKDRAAQRASAKTVSPGYISTVITVDQGGKQVKVVEQWASPEAQAGFRANLDAQGWYGQYLTDEAAYNAANNIVDSYTQENIGV